MVLQKLYEELGAQTTFDRALISAIVLDTLRSNNCNVTDDNIEAVKAALIKDVCEKYEFEVLYLATYWDNDLADLLCDHLGIKDELFKDHIWPFLEQNEVYPDVSMK